MSLLPRLALIGGATLVLMSCQSRGPVAPASSPELASAGSQEYTPAVALLDSSRAPGIEGTLGAWTLELYEDTATLIPFRSTAATPGVGTYEVDVTAAFSRTFCRDCVRIERISRDGDGRPVLTIAARHPFALGDPGQPPTAQNRRDLFLFNLRGIVAGSKNDITVGGMTLPSRLLKDADGFFPHAELFGGPANTAYPYMVFNVDENLSGTGNFDPSQGNFFDMDNPSGFNVLGQGQTGRADFTLDVLDGETATFTFHLVGRYGQSVTGRTTRLSPEYYAAQISGGPWRVQLDPLSNFSTNPVDIQGATVQVWDFAMAHGSFDSTYPGADHLGLSWDPSLTVEMLIPAFQTGAFTPSGAPAGTGAMESPLVYNLTLTNTNGVANGDYPGLVKVTSNRLAASTPDDPNAVFGIAADLDATNLFPIDEIATYVPFIATVATVIGDPPVADLRSSKDEVTVGNGVYLFPGPGTLDPDGTVVQWAYDFDWNGVPGSFTADVVKTNTDPVATTRFPSTGNVTVGMRVRDNDNNYAYDSRVITVVPVGGTFPPSHPQMSILSNSETLFNTADHTVFAVDRNHPNNVYILQNPNQTGGVDMAIYRSKDFGRSFDSGTYVQSVLSTHPKGGFGWISGRGIAVLADGSLGLVCNTTSAPVPATDGRGIYYYWIDVDLNGTGVNPGGGTHAPLRVNSNTALEAWGDPNVWGDANDPTRAYVTYYWNPSGADEVRFAGVGSANTANPASMYDSTVVALAENLAIDNVRSYLDPGTNHLHIAWEEFLTSTDRWIAYTRVVLNNVVGPRARISATSLTGGINQMVCPTPVVLQGGQAAVVWAADYLGVSPFDYDLVAAKILDSSGTQSFITPITRYTIPLGQNRAYAVSDQVTGRVTIAYNEGATTGVVTPLVDLGYIVLDNNLNLIDGPTVLQLSEPVVTYPHQYPFGTIDPNTGEAFFMWMERHPTVALRNTAWRWSR